MFYVHIGFMETLERGRVALWRAESGRGMPAINPACALFVGYDHKPMSVSGDPMSLRDAPCGAYMAMNKDNTRIVDHKIAKQISLELV